MIHNANWSKDIRLLQDHLISKLLSFFHAHNTTIKVSKLAIFHNLKLEGQWGGGGWVVNLTSNQILTN